MISQITFDDIIGGITQETAITVSSLISSVAADLPAAVNVVWGIVTANIWLQFMVGFSIVMLGFSAFRRAKRIAR